MDLKVNAINFQGKKEVLYALTKAAQKSKEYEINQTAYIASRIQMRKYEEQASKKGAINAYIDTAIHDSDFLSVVKYAGEKDLKPIKNILAPFQTEHGTVEPMKIFESITNEVLKASKFTNELLRKLKS